MFVVVLVMFWPFYYVYIIRDSKKVIFMKQIYTHSQDSIILYLFWHFLINSSSLIFYATINNNEQRIKITGRFGTCQCFAWFLFDVDILFHSKVIKNGNPLRPHCIYIFISTLWILLHFRIDYLSKILYAATHN